MLLLIRRPTIFLLGQGQSRPVRGPVRCSFRRPGAGVEPSPAASTPAPPQMGPASGPSARGADGPAQRGAVEVGLDVGPGAHVRPACDGGDVGVPAAGADAVAVRPPGDAGPLPG